MVSRRQVVRKGFLGIFALICAMVVFSPPTVGAATARTDAAAGNKVIRAGEVLWDNWSWRAELSEETYQAGAYNVLGVGLTGAWAGLYLHHDRFSTEQYGSILVHVRDITSSLASSPTYPHMPVLTLWLVDENGHFTKAVHLENYALRFQDSYFIKVPLSDLSGAETAITGVVLQDRSGATQDKWWVDSIWFK